MGAANGLSSQSGVAASRQDAGEHFHQCLQLIVPRQYIAVRRGAGPESDGVDSGLPGVGTDGVDRDAQRGVVDRHVDGFEDDGGTAFHRRFWDRLFVAELSAAVTDQHREDRSIVHPGNSDAGPASPDCAGDHRHGP